jgi:hypothetical protein
VRAAARAAAFPVASGVREGRDIAANCTPSLPANIRSNNFSSEYLILIRFGLLRLDGQV